MKHQHFLPGRGLPDAPLSMPKQALERERGWVDAMRAFFLVWQRR